MACTAEGVDRKKQSVDTTSFSLTGEYDAETETEGVRVCPGYSKDHRPDLKQMLMELVVSQDGGIPLSVTAQATRLDAIIVYNYTIAHVGQCSIWDNKVKKVTNIVSERLPDGWRAREHKSSNGSTQRLKIVAPDGR